MKVLVTMGGTRERIDDVRFISNLSTGRTGSVIADRLAGAGCEVVCLCGAGSKRPGSRAARTEEFSDFRDLDRRMRLLLADGNFDAVVHLAAVSDYSVKSVGAGAASPRAVRGGKISSEAGVLTLVLKRNFKILDRIKRYAGRRGRRRPPLVAAFKLTSGATRAAAEKAVGGLKAADVVVHNDLSEIGVRHPFHVYRNGERIADCAGARELSALLAGMISARAERGTDAVGS